MGEFNKNLRKADIKQNAGYISIFLLDENGNESLKKEDVLLIDEGTAMSIKATVTPQNQNIESGNSANPLMILSQGEESTLAIEFTAVKPEVLAKLQGYYYAEESEEAIIEQSGIVTLDDTGKVDFGTLDVQMAIFTSKDGTKYIATVDGGSASVQGFDKTLTITADSEKKSHTIDFGAEMKGVKLDAYYKFKDANHIRIGQKKLPVRPAVKIVHSFNSLVLDQKTRKKVTTVWYKMQLDGAVDTTVSKDNPRISLNFKALEPNACKVSDTTIVEVPLGDC